MPIAKSRDWTEAEVQEAIAAIKQEPGLWEEVEHIEKTTGDFEMEVHHKELRILFRLHQDCELNEITDLYHAIRNYRRAQLGLK